MRDTLMGYTIQRTLQTHMDIMNPGHHRYGTRYGMDGCS